MSGPPGEGGGEGRGRGRPPQPAGGGRPGGQGALPPAATGRRQPAGWSGVLDRGDLELEDDLVADQDAAGLERGVPGDAVVLAADGDRAVEADALVAERVLRGALERERDGDRLRHVLDGQVAGDLEGRLVDGDHA